MAMTEEPLHPSVLSNLIDTNLPPSTAQLQIARAILSQNERQIEKLDGEIAQLRERADRLTQEQQAVADSSRKMRSIVSPWRRLPPELLSHIFMLCAEDDPNYLPRVDRVPLLPLQVCHAWRSLALATPALWARLNFQIWKPGDIGIADTWLSRSGACSLELEIAASSTYTEPAEVEQLFKNHHHHIGIVTIDAPLTLLPRLLDGAPLLHTLHIQSWDWPKVMDLASGPGCTMRSLPSLRRLSGPHPYLYNFDIPWHQLTHLHMGGIHTKGTAHSNLRILSQCPALLLCSLSLDSDDGPSSTSSSEVVLSYLESLSLSVLRCNVPGPASQLFSSLTLPALRALAVAGSGPSPGVIESFLKRSACPLTTLRLARNAMSSADLMQWLRPVTATMDSLSLFVNIHPADDILYALTCNEKETCLCPNLRSIKFWGWSWASGLMADMIESRRRDTSSLLQEVDIAMDFQSCLDDVPRLQRLTNLGLKVKFVE